MWCTKRRCPRCLCHLLVAFLSVTLVGAAEVQDFIAVNLLPDGEVETRICYKGICAKETTIGKMSKNGVCFREVSYNKHLIQLIYDPNNVLQDCEVISQRDQVNKFLYKFKNDISNLITTSNITVESLENKQLPEVISKWLDFQQLREDCRQKHRELKRAVREARRKQVTEGYSDNSHRHSLRYSDRKKRSLLIAPGTLWCGDSDNALYYTQLGAMSQTDKCCRRHDHCRFDIPGYEMKFGIYNKSPFTISHCHCDARQKRDISDMLRVPGTEWCGKGYSADKYTRLGGFSRTDRCCRMHDTSCPFWIGGFDTKYGLFNWRVNTIMHCACDERFRACLKMVDSSDANLVGKLFFNVVQTKCFVLKPKKKCLRRSWWGKCEKHRFVKQAILRDNIPY